MHLGPLEERPFVHELAEALAVDEVVVAAVDLVRARRPRRVRDAEPQLGEALLEHPRERRLPGAAGGREDEEEEVVSHDSILVSYSTFCTCSRIRSISAFTSTMAWAIGASGLLAPTVLASRAISCKRKSSLRPIASGLARSCANWVQWLSRRVSSSAMSPRSAKSAISCSSRAGSTSDLGGDPEPLRALLQPPPVRLEDVGPAARDVLRDPAHGLEAPDEVLPERGALPLAHRVERSNGSRRTPSGASARERFALALDGGDEEVRDRRQERQRHLRAGGELVAQLAELLEGGPRAVAIEHRGAELHALDAHRHLEATAGELLARELLHEGRELGHLARHAHANVEEAMVDPPYFDGEFARSEGGLSRPEAGHTAHGSKLDEPRAPWPRGFLALSGSAS